MSQYTFSQVPHANIPRSNFSRSHGYKTTFDAGYLIPFYCDEVLPGDTFALNVSIFARMATPIVPIMDNLYLDTFFFFVPNRLLWNNWQRFMGEQDNPTDSTDFQVPQAVSVDGMEAENVYQYLGVPQGTKVTPNTNYAINAFYGRAYNLIWNQWFRDQNLQTSVNVPKGDGPDDLHNYVVLRRGKRHDYFTSALPWPQKGPGVDIPMGAAAPVRSNATTPNPIAIMNGAGQYVDMAASSANVTMGGAPLTAADGMFVDLTAGTVGTINDLRQAFQLQRLMERDARGGTRYIEILKSHFGVDSPDSRLQRPEYLGGSSQPVIINPVAQTAPTGTYADTPQGNLAAIGLVHSDHHGFTKSFVEHGVIIGLCMVRADLSYQQGMNRMFMRKTRYDYYWPVLAHLGEQTIKQGEIWYTGITNEDEKVWGYQERWSEYRYYPTVITGNFRSSSATPLDSWHLAQDFGETPPVLDASFIEENPPVDRVVATPNEPHFLLDAYFNINAARPMPLYSVPGFIDHF